MSINNSFLENNKKKRKENWPWVGQEELWVLSSNDYRYLKKKVENVEKQHYLRNRMHGRFHRRMAKCSIVIVQEGIFMITTFNRWTTMCRLIITRKNAMELIWKIALSVLSLIGNRSDRIIKDWIWGEEHSSTSSSSSFSSSIFQWTSSSISYGFEPIDH